MNSSVIHYLSVSGLQQGRTVVWLWACPALRSELHVALSPVRLYVVNRMSRKYNIVLIPFLVYYFRFLCLHFSCILFFFFHFLFYTVSSPFDFLIHLIFTALFLAYKKLHTHTHMCVCVCVCVCVVHSVVSYRKCKLNKMMYLYVIFCI
jgi:hypothetical protein